MAQPGITAYHCRIVCTLWCNNGTLHAYSKGIIRAHKTHCGRFFCACLRAIRRALLGGHCCKHEGQKGKGGERIRSGYLNPAFSGAQKRAEVLRNPAFSGVPNKGEQNQKWLPHPCLLGGQAPTHHLFVGRKVPTVFDEHLRYVLLVRAFALP